jgi:hypothetical protein
MRIEGKKHSGHRKIQYKKQKEINREMDEAIKRSVNVT